MIKKRLQHRCCVVNNAKFLIFNFKSFFTNYLRWLLRPFTTTCRNYYLVDHLVILFALIHPSKWLREAAVRRCFSKRCFKKKFSPNILQYLQETPAFSNTSVFLWILQNFQNTFFYRTHLVAASGLDACLKLITEKVDRVKSV